MAEHEDGAQCEVHDFCVCCEAMLTLWRTHANTTQSPLMSLPPEVRNRIWEDALGRHTLHLDWSNSRRNGSAERPKVSVCVAGEDDAHTAELIRRCTEDIPVADVYLRDTANQS